MENEWSGTGRHNIRHTVRSMPSFSQRESSQIQGIA